MDNVCNRRSETFFSLILSENNNEFPMHENNTPAFH